MAQKLQHRLGSPGTGGGSPGPCPAGCWLPPAPLPPFAAMAQFGLGSCPALHGLRYQYQLQVDAHEVTPGTAQSVSPITECGHTAASAFRRLKGPNARGGLAQKEVAIGRPCSHACAHNGGVRLTLTSGTYSGLIVDLQWDL